MGGSATPPSPSSPSLSSSLELLSLSSLGIGGGNANPNPGRRPTTNPPAGPGVGAKGPTGSFWGEAIGLSAAAFCSCLDALARASAATTPAFSETRSGTPGGGAGLGGSATPPSLPSPSLSSTLELLSLSSLGIGGGNAKPLNAARPGAPSFGANSPGSVGAAMVLQLRRASAALFPVPGSTTSLLSALLPPSLRGSSTSVMPPSAVPT